MDNDIDVKKVKEKLILTETKTIEQKKIIDIIKNKINTYMLKDIDDILNWRYRWRLVKTITQTLSHLCVFSITILSFGSAYFGDENSNWGFFNGLVGVLSIGLNRFSSYAKKQSKKKTEQVNKILESYEIEDALPDIMSSINNNDDSYSVDIESKKVEKPINKSDVKDVIKFNDLESIKKNGIKNIEKLKELRRNSSN
jgi:hypothetical protein